MGQNLFFSLIFFHTVMGWLTDSETDININQKRQHEGAWEATRRGQILLHFQAAGTEIF